MRSVRCIKGDDRKILVEELKITEKRESYFSELLMVRSTLILRAWSKGAMRVKNKGFIVVLVKRRSLTL